MEKAGYLFERYLNTLNISELIRHSKKYDIPFHIFIFSELSHERVEEFKGKKEEMTFVFANIMYDTPRPYQIEQVKKDLKPVRGIIEKYGRDPALDCCNLPIRTTNLEQNLANFIEIKKGESELLEDMIKVLSSRKYIKKFEDNNITYTIEKIHAISPPRGLSMLIKQYELYTQGFSVSEATNIVQSEFKDTDKEMTEENNKIY